MQGVKELPPLAFEQKSCEHCGGHAVNIKHKQHYFIKGGHVESYCIVILGHICSGFHQSQYPLDMCNLVDILAYILELDHCNLVDYPHTMHIVRISVPQQDILELQ